jgi:hypothetical protein
MMNTMAFGFAVFVALAALVGAVPLPTKDGDHASATTTFKWMSANRTIGVGVDGKRKRRTLGVGDFPRGSTIRAELENLSPRDRVSAALATPSHSELHTRFLSRPFFSSQTYYHLRTHATHSTATHLGTSTSTTAMLQLATGTSDHHHHHHHHHSQEY